MTSVILVSEFYGAIAAIGLSPLCRINPMSMTKERHGAGLSKEAGS